MNLFSSSIGDVNLPFISPAGIGQATPAPVSATDLSAQAIIGAQVYNANSATSAIALSAANISGASVEVDLALTGAITTAQNAQLPSVATLVAALPAPVVGQTYKLRVLNTAGTGSGTFTVTTNTGWTLNGTMTIAPNTWRDFLVTLTSLTAATLQNVGAGVTP